MMTWFEYAMSICALNDGGDTLKTVPTPALNLFVRTLEMSKSIYDSLSEETANALISGDYPGQFGRNLNEARRLLAQRGETARLTGVLEGLTSTPWTAPANSRQVQRSPGEDNGDKYMCAYPYGAERLEVGSIGIRCVRCTNHVIPLSPCHNCGGVVYLLGIDVLHVTALTCMRCSTGFTLIRCVCGCDNPIRADTIMRLKAKSGVCSIDV